MLPSDPVLRLASVHPTVTRLGVAAAFYSDILGLHADQGAGGGLRLGPVGGAASLILH